MRLPTNTRKTLSNLRLTIFFFCFFFWATGRVTSMERSWFIGDLVVRFLFFETWHVYWNFAVSNYFGSLLGVSIVHIKFMLLLWTAQVNGIMPLCIHVTVKHTHSKRALWILSLLIFFGWHDIFLAFAYAYPSILVRAKTEKWTQKKQSIFLVIKMFASSPTLWENTFLL